MKIRDSFFAVGLLIGTCGVLQSAQAEDDDPFGLADFNNEVDVLCAQVAEAEIAAEKATVLAAQAELVRPQLSDWEQKWLDRELFCAVGEGRVRGVQGLIARGANVIAQDIFGRIPLYYAYCCPVIMKILIDANPGSVNFRNRYGNTPLNMAVMSLTMDRLPAIRMLLSAGANVGIRSSNGATAVHEAAVFGMRGEILVSTLLAYAPEAVNVKHGRTGDTPLMWALYSDKSLIPFLISVGANPDIPNKLGKTPRKLAQELGCEDLLAEYGDTKPARAISLDISKKR